MYVENMIPGWEEEASELLQLPFSYGIHYKCVDENGDPRKLHIHIIIVFPNPTTGNYALSVLSRLQKEGSYAFAKGYEISPVVNIRNCYNYLLHDTDDCRKKHKYPYYEDDPKPRFCGNGFDIGLYEQVSSKEKSDMRKELALMICEYGFTNYNDFYRKVVSDYDSLYEEIASTYSAFFERLTRGNYQKKVSEV